MHPAVSNRGAEGGHRQNGKTAPQFVHKTLPVGNHAIWTISVTVTLCASLYPLCVCTPTTSLMWFSDGRRTQSNENPRFCPLGGLGGYEPGGRRGGTNLPIFRILGVLRFDVSNQSGRRLQYKSSTFEEIWTTPAGKFPFPIFPANPSGRRFLYKSSPFEEISTLVR